MKTYAFEYGSGTVEVPLDEAQVKMELHGNRVPPVENIEAALAEAVEHPVDSAPLHAYARPGDKVALIVSDMSRFWMRQDLVVPHLVAYLENECGISDRDLTIIIANGTHIGGDEAELRTLVTDAVYDRVAVLNHDCEAEDLVTLGVTSRGTNVRINRVAAEADRVICLGACTHHMMAGFGGGRKSIVPGIASLETIRQNHAHSLSPVAPCSNPAIGNGILKGNPLHEDMCEAAEMMKSLFMVNLVMNADMKLAKIFAGHWLHSWERGCEAVNRIYEVEVPEKADVIIASAGGYPKDMSLYQGTKTIDNVESGLKPGGTMILLMECREGGGPAEYFNWIKPLVEGAIVEELRRGFTIPGYVFFLNCEQARRYRIMMLTKVKKDVIAPMGIEAYSDIDSLLKAADLEGKSIYVIENGSTVIPKVRA